MLSNVEAFIGKLLPVELVARVLPIMADSRAGGECWRRGRRCIFFGCWLVRNRIQYGKVDMIQTISGEAAFREARIAYQAAAVLSRADAMGLLRPGSKIDKIDSSAVRLVLDSARRAGIGKTIHLVVSGDVAQSPAEIEAMLVHLNAALEESPVPDFEWDRVSGILGSELLTRLLGISPISLRRYRTKERPTPDDVAERLHLLAMICGDLAGSYNDLGIRQWFDRKRAQLGGRAPSQILRSGWDAKVGGPAQVRELARAITASPAT